MSCNGVSPAEPLLMHWWGVRHSSCPSWWRALFGETNLLIRRFSENIPVRSICTSPENMAVFHAVHTCRGGVGGDVYNPPVCLLFSHQGVERVNPTLQGMEKQIIQCPSQAADEGGAVLSVYLSWSRLLLGVQERIQVQARLHWHGFGKQVKTREFSKAKAEVSWHAGHTCRYRCLRVSRPPPMPGRRDTRRMTSVGREARLEES